MHDVETTDRIRLVIPAAPQYVRMARLAAAGLAADLDFTVDEIDDLRIAVDELVTIMVEAAGAGGEVEITYRLVDERTFEVVVSIRDGVVRDVAPLTEQIIRAIVDDFQIEPRRGTLRITRAPS